MASIDSPAAARRRIRLAVRKAREAKHLTQGDVAEHLEWSISKVNRIENGDVTISLTDLRAVMALLDITDGETVDELSRDAKAARKRGWWDDPKYRAHLTPATLALIQFESEATAIRCFQPTLVPGLLQTPDYARAVLDFWNKELPQDTRAARMEVRSRRSRLLKQQDAPEYLVIIDESAVMREIGGPAVMADQLGTLLENAKKPTPIIRIVPLRDGGYLSMLGGFNIFDLVGEENAVLYRENDTRDDIDSSEALAAHYRHMFELMWEKSYTTDESIRVIQAQRAALLTTLDRSQR